MPSYQINELEHLTGIKAHTIRMWEKRYELITPYRTITNRRYYDDDQVRKLLNVTTLLSLGYRISKIAALNEEDINTHILHHAEKETPDHKKISCINDLVKSMLDFDEAAFERLFNNTVKAYGMYDTMQQIIYPFLHKTGILWNVNKAIPVQEHFAVNIIRRKLITAIDCLQLPGANKKKFLLFLPPNEWHETGLLFADYMIREAGFSTIYLGQNVPYENIAKIAPGLNVSYMLLFYVANKPKDHIEKQLRALSKNNPGIQILVSGNPELFINAKSFEKNVTYLSEVHSILEYIK